MTGKTGPGGQGPGFPRGFTLLELMIAVSIVGILATIAQPALKQYVIRAREASLRNTLFVFRDVIDQYYGDHGKYPENLEVLVEKEYIRAIPADPFTRSAGTWILIPSPEGAGVYDVHSGSDLVSLDGTPYNEW
ncbi:MAG: prepilin-type N-terminal cleavage/methylation domain-containing protein [Desulfobacterales bacterium]